MYESVGFRCPFGLIEAWRWFLCIKPCFSIQKLRFLDNGIYLLHSSIPLFVPLPFFPSSQIGRLFDTEPLQSIPCLSVSVVHIELSLLPSYLAAIVQSRPLRRGSTREILPLRFAPLHQFTPSLSIDPSRHGKPSPKTAAQITSPSLKPETRRGQLRISAGTAGHPHI